MIFKSFPSDIIHLSQMSYINFLCQYQRNVDCPYYQQVLDMSQRKWKVMFKLAKKMLVYLQEQLLKEAPFIIIKIKMQTKSQIIDYVELKTLITQKLFTKNLSNSYRKLKRDYQLIIELPTQEDILTLAQKINSKTDSIKVYNKNKLTKDTNTHWLPGEQRLFQWIVFPFCLALNISFDQITSTNLQPIQKIFVTKPVIMLLFQVNYILTSRIIKKNTWKEQEKYALNNILLKQRTSMKENSFSLKWKVLAYQLFEISDGHFFRTPREVREIWLNYFNPDVSHSKWHIKEDVELFTLLKKFKGCKWSKVAKNMSSIRTQHMVKNRAHSLFKKVLNKRLKRISVDHIKTVYKYLLDVYNSQGDDKKTLQSIQNISNEQDTMSNQNMKDKYVLPQIFPNIHLQFYISNDQERIEQQFQPLGLQPYEINMVNKCQKLEDYIMRMEQVSYGFQQNYDLLNDFCN